MHEDLARADCLAVLHFLLRVALGEEVGGLGGELLEDSALIVLTDEGLIGGIVELVVVAGRTGDCESGDVLESGRKGTISSDVLVKVTAVLVLIVVEGKQEDVAVEFTLPLHPLLVPPLQLLQFLCTPP